MRGSPPETPPYKGPAPTQKSEKIQSLGYYLDYVLARSQGVFYRDPDLITDTRCVRVHSSL